MRIELKEDTHTYIINGDIASISVTELLHKHHLAPDYSGIKVEKMEQSAELGKKIHKDLENVLNVFEHKPETEQAKHFQKWVEKNLDCGVGEQKLGLDYKGMLVAGTADVMAIAKDKQLIVADHKNTSKFQQEYVTWQVSILDYMARKLGKEKVNGKLLNWKGATKFYCFHYNPKSGEMKVHKLDKIADEEIERLLECEFTNTIYKRKELAIDKTLEEKFLQAEKVLFEIETQYKQAKANAEAVREELCKQFEEQEIMSWESPNKLIKVTYVAPMDKISVDSAKLKNELPEVFKQYQKLTKQKGYIKITNRSKGDDGDAE